MQLGFTGLLLLILLVLKITGYIMIGWLYFVPILIVVGVLTILGIWLLKIATIFILFKVLYRI